MKTIKSVLAMAAIGLTVAASSAHAGDMKFKAADNSMASKLCVTATGDSKVAMLQQIKGTGFSKSYVQKNVTCNGYSIGSFAAQYGSDSVQNLLPADTNVEITDLAKANHAGGVVLISK